MNKPLVKYHVNFTGQDGKEIKTWGVFPVGQSKILDGIYNPESKELMLIFDSITEQYTDVPVYVTKGKSVSKEMQTRKTQQYYKFYLPEADIPFFLDTYVDNNFQFEVQEPTLIVNPNE